LEIIVGVKTRRRMILGEHKMIYKQLGSSNLKVSAIAFGAWAIGGLLWGGTNDDDAIAAIQQAVDLGMTTIDTAPFYGRGHSEVIIGKAIKGRRDQIQVLTKFGLNWESEEGTFHFETPAPDGSMVRVFRNSMKKQVIYECEQSLKRLGIDYIDLYQQHWPHLETPIEETFEAVAQLLGDGKIRYAGVSNATVEQIEAARKVVPVVSVQSPYSLINRKIERELIPYCLVNNLSVIAYSPMQRGLLSGKISADKKYPETDGRSRDAFFKPENRRKILAMLEEIRPTAETHNATLAQLVLAWTIQQPGITVALAGARNPQQVDENAVAAGLTLTQAEISHITKLSESLVLEL
jgi:aryl-alcohol dehydrogenase-like predicted oxidoreductase